MSDNYTSYYRAQIENSTIGENSIIGDLSRVRNSTLGEYCKIDRYNLIQNSTVGKYSYTGPFDMIFNTTIGCFSSISYGVTIGAPEHNYNRLSLHPFIYDKYYEIFPEEKLLRNDKFDLPCTIGNDVWIGCNSTVLRGVEIPDGVVIGANSIVTKAPEPYSIIAGNPAKTIKYRFSENVITKLLDLQWWLWPIEKIRANYDLFSNIQVSLEDLDNIQEV